MLHQTAKNFKRIAPAVDFWSLRLSDTRLERISVRQGIVEPIKSRRSTGALITLVERQGIGYAATSDLSPSGLKKAIDHALSWARTSARFHIMEPCHHPWQKKFGAYTSKVKRPWNSVPLSWKIDCLKTINRKLKLHDHIVDYWALLENSESEVLQLCPGAEISQCFSSITPMLSAVAHNKGETQSRSYGLEYVAQAGLEQLDHILFEANAQRVAEESLQLLDAPNCPTGQFDVLFLPSQMVLQIHESIGHPLELDRILGDERNYAGTSFVTLDMFGSYQYGSPLLNITFDPTLNNQIASYDFDDEGTVAELQYLIKNGVLVRPLGSQSSQNRAHISGVANSRSSDWNRAPIDRMANLNLVPGNSSLDDMIAGIEYGILMDTNRSWSIDDSRNKFQFGCELGKVIEKGKIMGLVKNPNYRGISAEFWRNLKKVGDRSTFDVMGVATCGKGEPNQAIPVGHASPACLFEDVTVFGGGG